MAIPLLGLGTLAKGLGLRKAGANLAKFIADRAVASGVTKDVAAMALPDVLMGSIYGSMTPGDAGDKLITGLTSTLGGVGGSMALRTALGANALKYPMLGMGAEMIGGLGGDMASQPIANSLMRMKSPDNMTPYEREYQKQNQQMQALIEQDVLQKLRDQGLLNIPQQPNPFASPYNMV